jgi:hypothetical protein
MIELVQKARLQVKRIEARIEEVIVHRKRLADEHASLASTLKELDKERLEWETALQLATQETPASGEEEVVETPPNTKETA